MNRTKIKKRGQDLHQKGDARTKYLKKEWKRLVEMFSRQDIDITEKTSGIASKNLENSLDPKFDKKSIGEIIGITLVSSK